MTEPIGRIRRQVNINIAVVAARFATPGSFEFLCECEDTACSSYLPMTLASFEGAQHPIVAPGHDATLQ